jgi:probable F420-dependent oxidoreductase
MPTTADAPGSPIERHGVRFGLALPQVFTGTAPDPHLISAFAAEAERGGFESLWVQSQLIGRSAVLDPVTLLAFAAASTSTVGLGASVLIAPEYHPVQLAKQLASLDQLSQGRLRVGLGTGSPNSTYEIAGMPRDRPARRLIESVEVMRALWTEAAAAYDGEIYRLDSLPMEPKPVQPGGPQIWLGGRARPALKRAATYGSGWMGPGASTDAMFREQVATLQELLAEAGRPVSSFTFAKRLYVTVDEDGDVARRRMRARLQGYGHDDQDAEKVAICGNPREARAAIERYTEFLAAIPGGGKRLLLLSPIHDFLGQQHALRELLVAG